MNELSRSIESNLIDLVADQFITDDDVQSCLDDFARGFLSPTELKDRLEFLLECAKARALRSLSNEERDADMGDSVNDYERDARGPWEAA